MNFSFWPFLWFGLPGQLLKDAWGLPGAFPDLVFELQLSLENERSRESA